MSNAQSRWMQKDPADPLHGWSLRDIKTTDHGSPKNVKADLYGNLYFFLRKLLGDFHSRLRTHRVDFELVTASAQDLNSISLTKTFDRVDASSLVDPGFAGLSDTLQATQPLLNCENKNATMVSLFMTAIGSMMNRNRAGPSLQMFNSVKRFLGWIGLPHDPMI